MVCWACSVDQIHKQTVRNRSIHMYIIPNYVMRTNSGAKVGRKAQKKRDRKARQPNVVLFQPTSSPNRRGQAHVGVFWRFT